MRRSPYQVDCSYAPTRCESRQRAYDTAPNPLMDKPLFGYDKQAVRWVHD